VAGAASPAGHEVARHFGKFRVVGDGAPKWECDGRGEAERMRRFFAERQEAEAGWIASGFGHVEPLRLGYAIAVVKKAGAEDAVAEVKHPDGRGLGAYAFRPNDEWAAYVMGEPTVSGSIAVDRDHVGHGYGHLLYEAAAKACGCPPVPHARNGLGGTLSDEAAAYWAKRAKRTRVPGFGDAAVAARAAVCADLKLLFRAERCLDDGAVCAAIAERTGWRARGLFRNADDAVFPEVAWCRLPDGSAFGSLQGATHHGGEDEWIAWSLRNEPEWSGCAVRDMGDDDAIVMKGDRAMAAAILGRYAESYGLFDAAMSRRMAA
jgi:GNAT superfamily N-acetyltransferase